MSQLLHLWESLGITGALHCVQNSMVHRWKIVKGIFIVFFFCMSLFAKCSWIRGCGMSFLQCWIFTGLPTVRGHPPLKRILYVYTHVRMEVLFQLHYLCLTCITDCSVIQLCRDLGTKWEGQGQPALFLPQGSKGKATVSFYTLWLPTGYA